MHTTKQQCQCLLDTYREAYDRYHMSQDAYVKRMEEWSARMLAHQQEKQKHCVQRKKQMEEEQRAIFHDSQYIEWEGKPYSCAQNLSTLHCTALASSQHEKCKCQQLFGGRPHLRAPCNPEGSMLTEPVTYERCLARGYLDNHDLELNMCVDHLPEHLRRRSERGERDDGYQDREWREPRPEAPVPPELPADAALKCPPCADALRELARDFTAESLQGATQCIANMQRKKPPCSKPKRKPLTEPEETECVLIPPTEPGPPSFTLVPENMRPVVPETTSSSTSFTLVPENMQPRNPSLPSFTLVQDSGPRSNGTSSAMGGTVGVVGAGFAEQFLVAKPTVPTVPTLPSSPTLESLSIPSVSSIPTGPTTGNAPVRAGSSLRFSRFISRLNESGSQTSPATTTNAKNMALRVLFMIVLFVVAAYLIYRMLLEVFPRLPSVRGACINELAEGMRPKLKLLDDDDDDHPHT